MNKYVKIISGTVVVGALVLAGAAAAFAQSPTPTGTTQNGFTPGAMWQQMAGQGGPMGGFMGQGGPMGGRMGRGGPGMMGDAGMMNGGGILGDLLADYRTQIHTKVAEALGLTLDELNTALAAGKTPATLAQEKGLDLTKVQAAALAAHEEALAQAVKDGKITQVQADALKTRLTEGQIMGAMGLGKMGGRHGRGGPMMGGQMGGAMGGLMADYQDQIHTQIAEALGLTLDEFNTALAAGKTPATLAQEKGIDVATLQAAAQAAHEEVLAQAVKDGKITQVQADLMKQHGAMMGDFGMGGRHGHFNRGFGPNNTPVTPNVTPAPGL